MTAPATRRFWILDLAPGVTPLNVGALLYGAFFTIGLLTFVSIGTAFVLNEGLGIPLEQQGSISGDLAFYTEVAQLCLFVAVGVAADRIGRRAVFALGMAIMGLGYFFYPLATDVGELTVYRVIYAIGLAAATGMLGTVVNDYPAEASRGKMVGIVGVFNGLGVVAIAIIMGQLPERLMAGGMDAAMAGRVTHWIVTALCMLTALVLSVGLKGGTPARAEDRPPIAELFTSGLKEGRNPRIALAYATAFVARSDLVILGTFVVLWGTTAGVAAGMDVGEATSQGTRLFATAQTAALLWAPVAGLIMDRVNRVTGVILCMSLAAAGYGSMLLVDDPLGSAALPYFILLGIGQISAFFGATVLIGQEAPIAKRGTVVGAFNFCGALGILISAKAGGILFDDVSPAAPFAMIGVFNLVVVLFAAWVRIVAPNPERPGT